MTEYGFVGWIIFIVVWVALMRYILPKMGIPTCMSGMCGLPGDFYKRNQSEDKGTEEDHSEKQSSTVIRKTI